MSRATAAMNAWPPLPGSGGFEDSERRALSRAAAAIEICPPLAAVTGTVQLEAPPPNGSRSIEGGEGRQVFGTGSGALAGGPQLDGSGFLACSSKDEVDMTHLAMLLKRSEPIYVPLFRLRTVWPTAPAKIFRPAGW